MPRKQIALILVVNALISALISLSVVAGMFLLLRDRVTIAPTAQPAAVPAGSTATAPPGAALPAATPVVHIVQQGDTITGLALQYDVPAEDIVAANQLASPDFLRVGMELIIPVGGISDATATFTPAPTATDTPIPFEPPSADLTATAAALAGATVTPFPTPLPPGGEPKVEITEVYGAGAVDREQVRITNTGQSNAELNGWTLSDADGNTYTFLGLTLWQGGSVFLHTAVGTDSPPSDFYWGKLQPIWSPGEIATLRDAAGQVVATFVVGP
jgi:LysM repeat protein